MTSGRLHDTKLSASKNDFAGNEPPIIFLNPAFGIAFVSNSLLFSYLTFKKDKLIIDGK